MSLIKRIIERHADIESLEAEIAKGLTEPEGMLSE